MPANPYYQSQHWRQLRAAALKRDDYRCTVPGCGSTHRLTVDHKVARPRWATGPTAADVLTNLRTLCQTHDNQVKEAANGQRRNGGALTVKGCDADGWPLDPARR